MRPRWLAWAASVFDGYIRNSHSPRLNFIPQTFDDAAPANILERLIKTVLPDLGPTFGMTGGICAGRFLDQVEHGPKCVESE